MKNFQNFQGNSNAMQNSSESLQDRNRKLHNGDSLRPPYSPTNPQKLARTESVLEKLIAVSLAGVLISKKIEFGQELLKRLVETKVFFLFGSKILTKWFRISW